MGLRHTPGLAINPSHWATICSARKFQPILPYIRVKSLYYGHDLIKTAFLSISVCLNETA